MKKLLLIAICLAFCPQAFANESQCNALNNLALYNTSIKAQWQQAGGEFKLQVHQ